MVALHLVFHDAKEGDAYTVKVFDAPAKHVSRNWLPRLVAKHIQEWINPNHIQWSFRQPASSSILMERVGGDREPRLQIDFLESGELVASVFGADRDQVDAESKLWWEALTLAMQQLEAPPLRRKWDCMIGPLPVGRHHLYKFKRPISVGGIKIPVPTQKMAESAPGFRYGFLLNNGHPSWPVMASGEYSSWENEWIPDEPMPSISSLCLILSLAMDQPWGPRHNPIGHPDHQLVIPRVANSAQHIYREELKNEMLDDGTIEIDLSKWCREAWEAQRNKAKLNVKNAMAMYQDGMILERNHQSLARIAYVSAIEALGEGNVKKCNVCGQHTGIVHQFRETVESAGMNFREDVFSQHYKFRSRSVHRADLDSVDSNWGQEIWDFTNLDVHNSEFNKNLSHLRRKVRSLILDRYCLSDPLESLS